MRLGFAGELFGLGAEGSLPLFRAIYSKLGGGFIILKVKEAWIIPGGGVKQTVRARRGSGRGMSRLCPSTCTDCAQRYRRWHHAGGVERR